MRWSRADVAEGPAAEGPAAEARPVATEQAWPGRFYVKDHIERPLVKW